MAIAAICTVWENEYTDALLCQKNLLPQERLHYFDRSQKEKQGQIIAAYGLLRYGLRHLYAMHEIPELAYDFYGKPFFKNNMDLHFNLSHTNGAALCAVGDVMVGADIEQIRTVKKTRAARLQLPEAPDAFFAQWTARECIVKCRGGSAIGCREPVSLMQGECCEIFSVKDQYAAGICTASASRVLFEMLPIKKLLDFLECENMKVNSI